MNALNWSTRRARLLLEHEGTILAQEDMEGRFDPLSDQLLSGMLHQSLLSPTTDTGMFSRKQKKPADSILLFALLVFVWIEQSSCVLKIQC